jgi:hypothetical protein
LSRRFVSEKSLALRTATEARSPKARASSSSLGEKGGRLASVHAEGADHLARRYEGYPHPGADPGRVSEGQVGVPARVLPHVVEDDRRAVVHDEAVEEEVVEIQHEARHAQGIAEAPAGAELELALLEEEYRGGIAGDHLPERVEDADEDRVGVERG